MQNTFILRKPIGANFADIIKIATMLQDQKKLKELEFYSNMQSISVFIDITKVADFQWKNADEVCHVIYIFFGFFSSKV